MIDAVITPRKPPRQARSRVTVDIILEAATRILASDGLAGFTTNRVAEVAGVSVGSLYQYYPNKAALVAALIERAQDAFASELEHLAETTEGMPLEAALGEFAALAVRQQYERPRLAAALDAEELRLPVQPILRDAAQRILASIERLAIRHGHPDPATVARDLFIITKAMVEADVGAPDGPPADLAERLHRATTGYLCGRAHAPDFAISPQL